MSGRKSTTWSYERDRRAAEAARLRQLAEEARQQAEARRALEEATSRAVVERAESCAPELLRLAEQLTKNSRLVDHVSRKAYSGELATIEAVAADAAGASREAERVARLSGPELIRKGLDGSAEVFTRADALVSQCRELLGRTEEIRFSEGPARQRELAANLGRLDAQLARATALAGSSNSLTKLTREVDRLRHDLIAGRFDDVAQGSEQVGSAVSAIVQDATERRERTYERRAVLDALRDSCRELRYRELNPKELERAMADPDAPWTLVVDTRTKGRISFTIEADKIRAETSMGVTGDTVNGDYCFTEFARIEEEMARRHGLTTQFRSEDVVRPDPPSGHAEARQPISEQARGSRAGGAAS